MPTVEKTVFRVLIFSEMKKIFFLDQTLHLKDLLRVNNLLTRLAGLCDPDEEA